MPGVSLRSLILRWGVDLQGFDHTVRIHNPINHNIPSLNFYRYHLVSWIVFFGDFPQSPTSQQGCPAGQCLGGISELLKLSHCQSCSSILPFYSGWCIAILISSFPRYRHPFIAYGPHVLLYCIPTVFTVFWPICLEGLAKHVSDWKANNAAKFVVFSSWYWAMTMCPPLLLDAFCTFDLGGITREQSGVLLLNIDWGRQWTMVTRSIAWG